MVVGGEAQLIDAERRCARAIEVCPEFSEAHYNMNVVLRRLGRQREAVDIYWEVLRRRHGIPRPNPAVHHDNNCHSDVEALPQDEEHGVAVLVVKWGDKYGPEYVNKLCRSILRHSTTPIDVICLTDDTHGLDTSITNLHWLPLECGWKGWWNKCQVFAPFVATKVHALGHRKCLYVDLDTVIVGNLCDLLACDLQQSNQLALLRTDGMVNEQRCGGYNSSLMLWSTADDARLRVVYEYLVAHFEQIGKYIYKFDHWLEVCRQKAVW